jgi:hypothetical protein
LFPMSLAWTWILSSGSAEVDRDLQKVAHGKQE